MPTRRAIILTILGWAGFLALLGVVPWGTPASDTPRNVADLLGYDVGLAYIVIAVWSCVIIAVVTLLCNSAKPR